MESATQTTPAPPELETLRIEVDGEIATMTLDRPDAFNAMSPQMIGELTVAFAWFADRAPLRGADHHRRGPRVLGRRRRQLVQEGRRRGGLRPSLRRPPRRRGPAPGDHRPAPDPLSRDRGGQRPGGRRRLLPRPGLRHPHRGRLGVLRPGLRAHRRVARRRHDLLPAPRRRPEPGAGDPAHRPEHAGRGGEGRGPRHRGRARRSADGQARELAGKLAEKAPHYVRMAKLLTGVSIENSLSDHLQLERHGIADSMATEDLRAGRDRFLRRREAEVLGPLSERLDRFGPCQCPFKNLFSRSWSSPAPVRLRRR